MKTLILGSLAVLAIAGGTAASAQPGSNNWQQNRSGYQNGGWDRDAFWRGAPNDPRERIGFLQQRIDRGIADGSLNRREGRQLQQDLNVIKRDARNMGRRVDARENARLQTRLDALGQRIRWERRDAQWQSDPRFATQYDASRYYRDGPSYRERRLGAQDEVYRGSDGRYYCKRNDGTTGLIVGAIGGGILGNVIDGGHSRGVGTILGAIVGGVAGKSIDQNNQQVKCR